MVKIVLFLCIFALTYGTEGSIISLTLNEIILKIESYNSDAETVLKSLMESMTNITGFATGVQDQVNDTVEQTIEQYNEQIASLSTTDTDIETSCMTMGIDITKMGGTLISKSDNCVSDVITNIMTGFEDSVRGINDFINSLNNLTTNARSCVSDDETEESCLTLMWDSLSSDIPGSLTTLTTDTTLLVNDISNVQNSITACGYDSTIETFANQAQDSFDVIKKCIADLNSAR